MKLQRPLLHTIAAGGIFLTGIWDVFCRGNRIGYCRVIQEGLYYRFVCQCDVRFDKVCCLHLRLGTQTENLGVLVPKDNGFGLNTRLPVKRFGGGTPVFSSAPKQEERRGKFVPIYPEEPFSYLSKIMDGYLLRRDGQIGIIVPTEADQ